MQHAHSREAVVLVLLEERPTLFDGDERPAETGRSSREYFGGRSGADTLR